MTTVQIKTLINHAELAHRYPGQNQQQPCYIELDCKTGVLTACYNSEIGTTIPFSVYHGHDIRWSIPCLIADTANELLAEIAPQSQTILDGYTSEWDGHNHVAHFTTDAQEAKDTIERLCYNYDGTNECVQIIDAGDYFYEVHPELGLTADIDDESLESIAALQDSEALVEGYVLDGTIEWLTEKREALKN